jgi:hypothetical protein
LFAWHRTRTAPNQAPNLCLVALLPHSTRTLNCQQPARPTCILIPTEMLYLLGTHFMFSFYPAPAPQGCLKALKIKHLRDVCKLLKIKDFLSTEKPPKSHRKATEKRQIVENQALAKILFSFSVLLPRPAYPTHPHPWHDFCTARNSTFLYISFLLKN